MKLFSITSFLFVLLADPSWCGGLVPSTLVQQVRTITPNSDVPIVQQLKQSNLDGSYTFGYESADGSFRTETRQVDGFVTGRYGYIDTNGQLREFDYAAGSQGLGNVRSNVGFQVRDTVAGGVVNTAGFSVPNAGAAPISEIRLANTADPIGTSFIQDPSRQIIVQQEPSLNEQVLIQQQPIQQAVRQQVISQPTINRFQQPLVVQQPAIRFQQSQFAPQTFGQLQSARQVIVQQPQIVPQTFDQFQSARQVIVQQPFVQQGIQQIIAPQRQLFSSQIADPFAFQSQRILVQPQQFISPQRQFITQPTSFIGNNQLFGEQQVFQQQSQLGLGLRTQNPFGFTQQQVVPFGNQRFVDPFIGGTDSFGARQAININGVSGFGQQQPNFVSPVRPVY